MARVLLAGLHATAFLSRDQRSRSVVRGCRALAKSTGECHRRMVARRIVVRFSRGKLLLGVQNERTALVRGQPRRVAGAAGFVRRFRCGNERKRPVALIPERNATEREKSSLYSLGIFSLL